MDEGGVAKCFDKITTIPILRPRFNPPLEAPECNVCIVFKQYAIFNSVDILERILHLDITRELLDILPDQALRHVVSCQIMCYTTLYTPSRCQWKKAVCVPLRASTEAHDDFP